MAISPGAGINTRAGTSGAYRRLVPLITSVAVALALGLLLSQLGYAAAAMVFTAIAVAFAAMLSPYWALVIGIAQWAFIPSEGAFFSIGRTPNQLQFIGPLLVIVAFLQALKDRAHDRLRPRLTDYTVGAIGVWGLVGLILNDVRFVSQRWYVNRMFLPTSFYYAVRLIDLNRERFDTLLKVALGAVSLQAILMIRQSWAGSSPIYSMRSGTIEGVRAATGPFPFYWNAGTFLALWPPVFIYMIANARTRRSRWLWSAGLLLVLVASTRTMMRGSVAASLLAILVCLLSSQLRRTTGRVIAVLAVAFIPWSLGAAGSGLMDRFDQTDESRVAYRTAAVNLLKSDDWNPIYGIGWSAGYRRIGHYGTNQQVVAWGEHRGSIAEIAEGSQIHNVWLAMAVELGGVGVLLALAVIVPAIAATLRILRRAREHPLNTGLLTAVWASLIALGAIGYYQNIWHYPASMSVMWLLYGTIVSKPNVFDLDDSADSS